MQRLICNRQKKKNFLPLTIPTIPQYHKYISLPHSNYMKSEDLLIVWKIPSFSQV